MDNFKGLVFNIVHGSFVDGWGIRTTVFLKGCPLKCLWCCNPEGQKFNIELKYTDSLCNGCGRCIDVCPAKAISLPVEGKNAAVIDRSLCSDCLKCTEVCNTGALDRFGRFYTVDELFDIVRSDERYYRRTGGGVTVGGGEPTAQAEFLRAFLKKCRDNYIHTAVDTCGYTLSGEAFETLKEADLLLFDCKGLDPERHVINTGVPNDIIINNLKRLDSLKKPIIIRLPLVPGYNDTGLEETAAFLSQLKTVERVDLMNYHEYGKIKYGQLGREYKLNVSPYTEEQMEEVKKLFESYSLNVQIGG